MGVVETSAGRGIGYIYVPLQGNERRPFLVSGKDIDGKLSSVFVSMPVRRDDDTAFSDVASLHGLLLAGRIAIESLGGSSAKTARGDAD